MWVAPRVTQPGFAQIDKMVRATKCRHAPKLRMFGISKQNILLAQDDEADFIEIKISFNMFDDCWAVFL